MNQPKPARQDIVFCDVDQFSSRFRRRLGVRRSAVLALGLMLLSGTACTTPDDNRATLVADIRSIVSGGQSRTFENTVSGNYLVGLHALQQGDFRTAADSFESALRTDRQNIELRRQIFLLHVASGDFESAIEDAEALVDVDPDNETAFLMLALRDANEGDFDDALERMDAFDERGAIGVIRPLLRAWAMYGAGNIDDALAALDAESEDTLADKSAFYRGIIEALTERYDEADRTFEALLAESSGSRLQLLQSWAFVQQELGRDDAIAARIDEEPPEVRDNEEVRAIVTTAEAGETLSLPIASATDGLSDTLFTLALFFDQQDIPPEAMRFGRLASYLRPDDGSIWLEIGRIALQLDNPTEAIRAFDRIDQDSPFHWEGERARAFALYDLERTEESLEALRIMDGRDPDKLDATTALGDLLRREQRFSEAEEAYSAAITRITEPREGDWRIFYNRGITYERTDRWPEAEEDFLKALELSPDQPFVLNYLGYSWVDQGLNLDQAKEMLHTAVELRPNDGFIVDSLGWAYYRLGDFEKAVDYLERAVELEPGDPVLNDHLGDAYWRVGRYREARFQWDRALSLEPEDEDIGAIEAKLEHGLPDETQPDRG